MMMALQGNTISLADVDNVQFAEIKRWNLMRWDRKSKKLKGFATLELLDKLAAIVVLPTGGISPKTGEPLPNIAAYRQKLRAVQDAVDRERVNPNPKPLYKYPVKMPLYAHQVRGSNMALITFGWTAPGDGT